MTAGDRLWHVRRMHGMHSRRTFIHLGLMAAGAAGCARLDGGRRRSPGGEIRLAVAGLRSKGWAHVGHLLTLPGVRLAALCDVDREILADRRSELERRDVRVQAFEDFRKLIEMRDLDGVIIATPNHQHTLQTIWACEAGLDVYVEKPVSHNLHESRAIARAAARTGRIVQAGTQGRSNEGLVPAMAYIHAGGLGKLKLARGFCYRERTSIGKTSGPQPVPEQINYDLWCGPAPKDPLRRGRLHYDWHWFWSTGNGEIGNQGVHELDMCRWAIGAHGLPARVFSFGGRFGYEDDAETPNTQVAWLDYQPVPILFEVRGLPRAAGQEAMDAYRSLRVGVMIEGEHGYFAGGQGGGRVFDWNHQLVRHFPGDGGREHLPNFLSTMRTRKPAHLTAPVAECATSSGLCHLANIAYRTGRLQRAAEIRERLPTQGAAAEALDRVRTHLAENRVDFDRTPLRAGGWLEWDNRDYRFIGGPRHEEANGLVTRAYRAGFEVA